MKPLTPPMPCECCLESPVILDAGDGMVIIMCMDPGCNTPNHTRAQPIQDAIDDWNVRQWGDQMLLVAMPGDA